MITGTIAPWKIADNPTMEKNAAMVARPIDVMNAII
jgi:hypothetical protein